METNQPATAAPATARAMSGGAAAPSVCAPWIAWLDRCDISDHFDSAENADPRLANDPWLKIEAKDAIEPIENADPTEPIDRTEPFEPIDRNESSDHSDHLWDMGRFSQMRLCGASGAGCPAERQHRFRPSRTPVLLRCEALTAASMLRIFV